MGRQKKTPGRTWEGSRPEERELQLLWDIYVERRQKSYFVHRSVLITALLVALFLIVAALFVDDDLAWSALAAVRSHIAQIVHYATNDITHTFGIQ